MFVAAVFSFVRKFHLSYLKGRASCVPETRVQSYAVPAIVLSIGKRIINYKRAPDSATFEKSSATLTDNAIAVGYTEKYS